MDPLPTPPLTKLWKAKLAGGVYALTVILPALYIPGFVPRSASGGVSVSGWMALPVVGSIVFWLLLAADAKKWFRATIMGLAWGSCSYLAAASWAAGSVHTTRLELMLAMLVGPLLLLLPFGFWLRWRDPAKAQAVETAMAEARSARPLRPHPPALFLILLVSFGMLSVMNILYLNKLDRHEPPSQMIGRLHFSLFVSIYDRFGYWPGVMFPPLLGAALLGFGLWHNHRAASQAPWTK
jgi:hypothetical protein